MQVTKIFFIILQQTAIFAVYRVETRKTAMTRQEAAQFYRKHSQPLYNAALRILRNRADAEEVMQDTLLKYLSLGVRSASDAQAAAWLRTTCVRRSIDLLRARKKDLVFEDVEAAVDVEEETDLAVIPPLAVIRKAMDEMPPPYGLVLNLVLTEGLSYAEIAKMTGQKENTLRSVYARGKARLAAKLKNWNDDE